MRPQLALREFALAGLALLAVAAALAVAAHLRRHAGHRPVPVGSYVALAGSSGPAAFGRRTTCGGVITPETEGVTHPTLPCGARIFVTFHSRTVLVQVVDHGPTPPGREFDVTDALARRLGLSGVQSVHWSYARAG